MEGMEGEVKNGWNRLLNCEVELVFDDLKAGGIKTGFVKEVSNDLLILSTQAGIEAIPLSRIARVKVLREARA